MKHPKPEEWVPYLFGEAKEETHRQLKAHLHDCPQCREQMGGWKSSLGRLDAWQLPRVGNDGEILQPFLKWAAAAAIMLCLGIGIGRITSASANVEKVRAAIEPAMRQQLESIMRAELASAASANLAAADSQTRKLLADYAKGIEITRAEDNQAVYAALEKLDAQRIADVFALKKELDTVAVNTDAGLRHTEQGLVRLAGYAQPAAVPDSLQK